MVIDRGWRNRDEGENSGSFDTNKMFRFYFSRSLGKLILKQAKNISKLTTIQHYLLQRYLDFQILL